MLKSILMNMEKLYIVPEEAERFTRNAAGLWNTGREMW